jgi:hypothetical protein
VVNITVEHVDLRSAANFTGEFLKRRLKIIFAKENAWQPQCVQFATKFFRANEGRSENLEWSRRAATFGDIRPFE